MNPERKRNETNSWLEGHRGMADPYENCMNHSWMMHHGELEDSFERALAFHQEAFFMSRAELSRCEADFRGLSEESNALKLLSGQKDEEIKDLQAELAKAHQEQIDLIEQVVKILKAHGLDSGTMDNISISQLQQKIERIEQFCEEVDTIKVESLGWKEGMVRFAAEKEVARAQLSSVESQLQGMKEKSSTQARKIEELEAREKLEEIHARCFDLTNEIIEAREHEIEAGALATSDDDDDDDVSKSESEEREDLDVE
ncbi:filament-like plant protein 3 [Nicotiana tomentosiformis]|uniref:filament-like plant protein 3 n=1 Tax=Nicotiana tomentosiformis TaxID=4098 RepID=UPI00388CD28E